MTTTAAVAKTVAGTVVKGTFRSIPATATDTKSLAASVDAMKELLETMTGQRGDGTKTVALSRYVSTTLSDLRSKVSKLQSVQTQVNTDLDTFNQRITAIETLVSGFDARITELERPKGGDTTPPAGGSQS